MICCLGWHAPHPMLRRRRDEAGKADPHVLEWECRACHRIVAVTEQKPRWTLLARLRRQVRRAA